MKKKGILVAVSLLLVLGLLIGGCAKAPATTTPTTPAPTTPKPTTPSSTTPKPTTTTAPTPTQPQAYKWKFQTIHSTGERTQQICIDLADEVRAMSDGRLDITVYPTGALMPATEMLDAVRTGTIDMCWAVGSYWSGKIGPIGDIEFGLLGLMKNPQDHEFFYSESGMMELLREVYAKQGVYYLRHLPTGSETIVLKVPVSEKDDFKGLKVRDVGVEAKIYAKFGAAIVYVPGGEIYTSLQTGVIDAAGWGGPYLLHQKRLYEVAKYLMWPAIFPCGSGHLLVNPNSYNALPDDLKAILNEAAAAHSLKWNTYSYGDDQTSIKGFLENGATLVSIPRADFDEAAMEVGTELAAQDEYAAKAFQMLQDYVTEMY